MRIAAYALLAAAGVLWHEPWGAGVVSAAADNIRELIAAAQGAPPAVCLGRLRGAPPPPSRHENDGFPLSGRRNTQGE